MTRVIDANLSGGNTVSALNEVVVSLLNYSPGVIVWTEIELLEFGQMFVKLLRRFCNQSKPLKSRKCLVLTYKACCSGTRSRLVSFTLTLW